MRNQHKILEVKLKMTGFEWLIDPTNSSSQGCGWLGLICGGLCAVDCGLCGLKFGGCLIEDPCFTEGGCGSRGCAMVIACNE